MSKPTIFGEEHFIDKSMVQVVRKIDDFVIDEIHKNAVQVYVEVNRGKLERWLRLCANLEQIDKSDLIDFAVKKKFYEKDQRIADLEEKLAVAEKALELACETFCSGSHPQMRQEIEQMALIKGVENYFKAKAKELKEYVEKEVDDLGGIPYDCKSPANDFEMWMLNKLLDKMQELEPKTEGKDEK